MESEGKAKLASGQKLLIFGIVSLALMVLVLDSEPPKEWKLFVFGGFFVSIVALSIGRFHSYRGRQLLAKINTESVLNDDNPDVLYLRSFNKDSNMRNYLVREIDNINNIYTEEEQLAEALKPFGDLVAIGKPGEKLPTPGAARVYVGNHEWQEVVINQMKNAKLVIIKIGGDGEGLNWEIVNAHKYVPQGQLLFYVNMKKRAYKTYRQVVGNKINLWLPEDPSPYNPYKPMNGFVRYTKNGSLEYLPLKSNLLHTSDFSGRGKLTPIRYALKPVFQELSVPWQEPPISKLVVYFIVFVSLVLLDQAGFFN